MNLPTTRRIVAGALVLATLATACSSSDSEPLAEADPPTTTLVVASPAATAPDAIDLGGRITGADLPDDLPAITVEGAGQGRQPGWTLFNLRRFGGPDTDTVSWVVMTDEQGSIRWLVEEPGAVGLTTLTPRGHVLYILDDHTIREVDLDGNLVREYVSDASPDAPTGPHPIIPVDVENFHHEVTVLPDGNLLVLASETAIVESTEPLCDDADTFDGTYKVIGDEVVEIDAGTGEVHSRRSLFSVFDPVATPGTDFCAFGAPFGPFPDDPEANDWSHANAASIGPDGEIVVSIRHLETVLAWPGDDPDADPLWVFGPSGTIVAPAGDEFWHQHAPEVLADGTLLVYDNGNGRTDATGEVIDPPFSRVAQYRLGTDQAELIWEYRRSSRDLPVYAPAVGDVDRLANGNTLIVDGFIGLERAEIVEVSPDGDVVERMSVAVPDERWLVYRAERIDAPAN
ncbi:MAG: aryl-sulfate sulfotransferase [Actinomycetota bacterium]